MKQTQDTLRCILLSSLAVGAHGFSSSPANSRGGVSSENAVPTPCTKQIGPSALTNLNGLDISPSISTSTNHDNSSKPQSRRQALVALTGLVAATSTSLANAPVVNAFEKNFPSELTEMDPSYGITLGTRTSSSQRATAAAEVKQAREQNIVNFNLRGDLFPSVVWGGALWLLSGSRSNPLTTPLANALYDEKKEPWLKDRNAGLFAAPPLPFIFLLGFVFVCLGGVTEFMLLQLAEGDSGVCSQLACVSLIAGGALELGRIANGEKGATREESDRAGELKEEFDQFATKRLQLGGNCHRSDVVASFRRFYAKYRQADSEKYPLTDLEIEQLLRAWNKLENRSRAEMTSGGFYYGLQINNEADVFR